ncbi:hypothetical protein F0U61_22300 [Archangium violaceum]|uniref:hypothetical protein n=1 Tax=Archangium violaceum TaxID=83451 RepID=UPI002B323E4D|nr:hypothetical protein F0U61_22300 [Archangium violaceum]
MSFSSNSRWAAGFLAAWLLSGCAQEERTPPSSNEAPAGSGQVNAPFDVQKVMDQVHFAFRPQGSAWEGGHSTYAVRVETDGFSVTPYHYPREQPKKAKALQPSQEQRAQGLELPMHGLVEGEPVSFGSAHVTRGGMLLSNHEAEGQVQASGSLTIARSGVAEHFHNTQDGVEQSWSFEQKPSGTGDLEVRQPVRSGRYRGETVNGLHFVAGGRGLGVRYGHGTWVDAEGKRTPVPARFEADSIVLRVPTQVVDASTYPAVLDPIVSPETGMDDPVNGPADANQWDPAIAHNGTNFLVVWYDYRSGNSDIYGARVSNTGTVLDTTGIRISKAIGYQYSPAVAHDGTNFLVVWHDSRSGSYDIYGARVSGTGTVLDIGGIPISTAINEQSIPSVTHDGTNFLVVWQDYRSGSNHDIYGARVSGTGTVLDISGIPISTAANNQNSPAVASNGTNSLVVWQDTRGGGSADIYGARVSNTGTVLNTSGILISNAVNAQEDPAVSYNGADFMVVWQDYRSGTNYDIYGARVSGMGVVRNPSGIPISTATNNQKTPALAREGTNCLVVWQDTRSYDIYGTRVSSIGTVLDTSGILISTSASYTATPAVAHDGTNFLVVWQDQSHINSPNIYGARVSGTGTVLDASDISISRSANGQYTPSVAHDGTNFLVVWLDYRGGYSAIYGARVDETGTVVLDTSGIPISTGNYKEHPVVTFGGTDFLVVWHEYHDGADIYGARVSSDGTVLDTSGIPISTTTNSQYNPVVAHDGANFLVVWQDYRSGTGYSDIYGARVSSDGTVLDTSGIPISTATNGQNDPVVTYNQNFLVVWQDYRSGGNADIYGARVSSDGTVLETSGVLISSTTNSKDRPSVAHNGTNFLVVWSEYRSSTGYDIYGARVTSAGTLLDTSGISISAATNHQHNPVVAYDGANFMVVWQDYRSGTGFSDIYGARVNEMGKALDTSGIAISTEPEAEVEPTVTAMGGEYSLVVYRRSNPSPSTNSERVMARLISPL